MLEVSNAGPEIGSTPEASPSEVVVATELSLSWDKASLKMDDVSESYGSLSSMSGLHLYDIYPSTVPR